MAKTTFTPTESESVEALRNDYRELMSKFDPAVVKIEREQPQKNMMCLLHYTVNGPTFFLNSEKDVSPKPTSWIEFWEAAYYGYPAVPARIFYRKDFRLASVNVWPSGYHCTGNWYPETSSLYSIADKAIRGIIYVLSVRNYGSMACPELKDWQQGQERKGAFPTIPPARLYRKSPSPKPAAKDKTPPPLPTKQGVRTKAPSTAPSAPPPLPARRG